MLQLRNLKIHGTLRKNLVRFPIYQLVESGQDNLIESCLQIDKRTSFQTEQ